MVKSSASQQHVQEEAIQLRNRLEETEETLRAIRQYMVDAFVVTHEDGVQVITLGEADFPYRKMVEAMNEGAVTLISDGTIFYCNPCFARMVQMQDEDLIGVQFKDLILPEQRALFDGNFKRASQSGTRGEFTLKRMQAGHVPVQLSMYGLGGQVNGISIIVTDITERMRSEEKIRSLAAELTIAEHEERYRISQILHDDLQQHLFAIKTQLSLLKMDQEPAKVLANVEQVEKSLSDAIALTRNLSIDLSPSVLRGEGLAQAILWLCARMREQHGLQLKISATDHLNLSNDHMRGLIFQAVRELLFNIVKHAGTLEATLTLERSGGQGLIIISDAGKGFDTSILTTHPASAHGLLLLQDRIRLMHGDMRIDSKPGDGTRVVVEFPME